MSKFKSSLASVVNKLRLLLLFTLMKSYGNPRRVQAYDLLIFKYLITDRNDARISPGELRDRWNSSILRTLKGDYQGGKRERIGIVDLLNSNLQNSNSDRKLHPEWGQNIGHIGSAMALAILSKYSHNDKREIRLTVSSEDYCHNLATKVLGQSLQITSQMSHDFSSSVVQNWINFDRIWGLLDNSKNYLDYIDLSERVYSHCDSNKDLYFKLPLNYEDLCMRFLESHDLLLPKYYIALHLRSGRNNRDARYCTPRNYEGVIKAAINGGYSVVIFGDCIFDFGFDLPDYNVLDLRTPLQEPQVLIPYLIRRSKGFISSMSGPAYVAYSLGIPTLTTNSVAPNWSFHATGSKSFFLPKTWVDENENIIPFREVLNSFLGDWAWTSWGSPELKGRKLRENSVAELVAASNFFMEALSENASVSNEFDNVLLEMREGSLAHGTGKIVPTYLLGQSSTFFD